MHDPSRSFRLYSLRTSSLGDSGAAEVETSQEPALPSPHHRPRITFPASPSPHHPPRITFPASPSPHHPPRITFPASPSPHHRPRITLPASPSPHHPPRITLPASPSPHPTPRLPVRLSPQLALLEETAGGAGGESGAAAGSLLPARISDAPRSLHSVWSPNVPRPCVTLPESLSPQLASLEESLELLRDRCCQLARSCNDFAASLGESFEAESAFVHAMERFFGAPEDAVSIATGGPVLGQFVMTLRDLTIFKETLKSQMEHVLHDRITNFVENDLNNLKEVRRRYDKAGRQYDQMRERFLSLKKGIKAEVAAEADEDLQTARMQFEQARFNLMTALSSAEAKKKHVFLESIGSAVHAHLRYFKQGYELLQAVEPYIHQVILQGAVSGQGADCLAHVRVPIRPHTYLQALPLPPHALMHGQPILILSIPPRLSRSRRSSPGAMLPCTSPHSNLHSLPQPSSPLLPSLDLSTLCCLSLSQPKLAERIYQFRRTPGRGECVPESLCACVSVCVSLCVCLRVCVSVRVSPCGRGPYRPSGGVTSSSVEQMMRAGAGGQKKVQVIKQGYLVRRTAAARSRHFFVLDSRGSLYYHKDAQNARSDTLSSLFSLVRARTTDATPPAPPPANPMAQHYRPLGLGGRGGSGHGEEGGDDHSTDAMGMGGMGAGMGGMGMGMGMGMGEEEERNHALQYESLNLLTATIKMDADEPDLRFCFRLVTPDCTHTLQAESAAEQRDWMEKITAVIASLLNSHTTAQPAPSVADLTISHRAASQDGQAAALPIVERPLEVLGYVSGNDRCADCSRAHPDWASLNLCVLLCIDCSGVHRNLGVHRSKVRSLTLDVKVWTAPLVRLMAIVGNDFANSVWEQQLKDVQGGREGNAGSSGRALTRVESGEGEGEDYILLANDGGASMLASAAAAPAVVHKPADTDSLAVKEQYIHCKYVAWRFLAPSNNTPSNNTPSNNTPPTTPPPTTPPRLRCTTSAQQSPHAMCHVTTLALHCEIPFPFYFPLPIPPFHPPPCHHPTIFQYVERRYQAPATDNPLTALHHLQAAVASCDVRSAFRLLVTAPVDVNADVVGVVASTAPAGPGTTRGGAGRTGQRLLHVACERGDEAMVELLLLWGAVVNVTDAEGRTPMQVALQHGNHGCSKLLASRCVVPPKMGQTVLM
ncbi:unnamed protein product [Closterium sp. NIES-65]|nr:unnamed protein product [Closterium sp. NIES-65]